MIASVTKHEKVLTLQASGQWIFKTLDDCFGMDRVRSWAKEHGVVLVDPSKAA